MTLTRKQIEQTPIGRELDALVAEYVLQALVRTVSSEPEDYYERRSDRPWEAMPYYSYDIGAIWEVFVGKGWILQQDDLEHGGKWRVYENGRAFEDGIELSICSTAPEAICRAALLSVL